MKNDAKINIKISVLLNKITTREEISLSTPETGIYFTMRYAFAAEI